MTESMSEEFPVTCLFDDLTCRTVDVSRHCTVPGSLERILLRTVNNVPESLVSQWDRRLIQGKCLLRYDQQPYTSDKGALQLTLVTSLW